MQSLSDLLRAEPFHEDAVHARLESLGFSEAPGEKKSAPQRAFSTSRRRVRTASVNASNMSTPPAPARPTARAAKLIDGFATNAAERESLFKVLDEVLEDLSRAAGFCNASAPPRRGKRALRRALFFFVHFEKSQTFEGGVNGVFGKRLSAQQLRKRLHRNAFHFGR